MISAANISAAKNSVARPVTVLMYHAIDEADAVGADPYYTVHRPGFAEQLRVIRAAGRVGSSVLDLLTRPSDQPAVAITFDDGHASNRHAAETLAAVGMTADFFVNPSSVGTIGFLTWPELREMHAMGMSIQSHGMVHRYLNDLSPPEVRQELTESRDAIEQQLGAPVPLFAPAGGRMPAGFARTARAAGYRAVCSSAVGFWSFRPGLLEATEQDSKALMLPRLAVLAGTHKPRFSRWVNNSRRELLVMKSRGTVLNVAKRAVGNQRYERLRQALVGGSSA